jgi:hypothetical protein
MFMNGIKVEKQNDSLIPMFSPARHDWYCALKERSSPTSITHTLVQNTNAG